MPRMFCRAAVVPIILLAAVPRLAGAQQSASVTVTYEVREVSELAFSGNPARLVVQSAQAGSAPAAAVDNSTTWSITTNEDGRKVTGAIDALPDHVTLELELAAPPGATSAGSTGLSPAARDLVTDISSVAVTELPVTYRLYATTAAGVIPGASATITLTLAAGI